MSADLEVSPPKRVSQGGSPLQKRKASPGTVFILLFHAPFLFSSGHSPLRVLFLFRVVIAFFSTILVLCVRVPFGDLKGLFGLLFPQFPFFLLGSP